MKFKMGPEGQIEEYADKLKPGDKILVTEKYVEIKSIILLPCPLDEELVASRRLGSLWKARYLGTVIALITLLLGNLALFAYLVLQQKGIFP